jgi:hypothetical protein
MAAGMFRFGLVRRESRSKPPDKQPSQTSMRIKKRLQKITAGALHTDNINTGPQNISPRNPVPFSRSIYGDAIALDGSPPPPHLTKYPEIIYLRLLNSHNIPEVFVTKL